MTPRRIKAVWQFTCVSRLTQALVCCAIGLVSLFGTGVASAGVNRWTSNGPEGGSILAFVIDPATPTTLYIGTLGSGVLKSLDGGASWSAMNSGL